MLFAVLGAAMAIVGLVLPGDELLTKNQRADAQIASQPNIVFVMTDDQPESTLSYMANVQFLKAKGLTFTNAFNVYPLCCPSRAIIQRGQYAHNTQIFGNGSANYGNNGGYPAFDRQDLEKSTVATWLHDVGYRTSYFGKYMNNFDPQVHPPPPGWDVFETGPGFRTEDENVRTAESAMAQLRQDAPNAPPFFLQVDFMAPHVPNNYESQDAAKFAGERVPRVASFDEQDVTDKPRYIRQDKPPLSQQTNPHVHESCKDNETNSIQQNDCEYVRQLRNLQTVDRFIKDMTDYLASQGELSNTYIVYYTDNSNHWGEHRLDHGKMTPYKTDTNFPLLIRGPKIPEGAVSTKLIGNHDIAPTFAEMAGASTQAFVDGRSFLRVADADPNNDSPWRTGLYIERRYKPEWKLPSKEDSGQYVPPYEGVREENLLYVHYHDDPWTAVNDAGFREFYDLNTDPYELRNLAYYGEVPQATLDRLEGRLLRLGGCKAEGCRAAEDEPTTNTTPPDDTTAPETSITSGPAEGSSTTSTSATFSFTSNEQGSTFKCQLSKDGTITQPWAACTSPMSYSNLTPGNYTFEVQATDPAGNVDPTPASRNWTVTSPSVDTTPPTIESTIPAANNATGVAGTANVAATFSEEMLASSINAQTFKLTKKGSSTKIAATVTYDATTDTATLDPTNSLQSGRTYKAVVSTGAKDLAGNPLAQQKAWSFTVR
jgi:N-acetylglucosamine-6-sulfatase